MATAKTLPAKITYESFLSNIPDEKVKQDCYEIVAMMREASKEEPVMWGTSIIGFGQYHYKYESGHEGDMCIMGFSPRKQNFAFYLPGGHTPLATFLEKLGKYKTGKGCLYIKKLVEIDRKVLQQMFTKSYQSFQKKKD